MTDTSVHTGKGQEKPQASPAALSEKQRRELWLYIGVSLVAVELLLAVGGLFYGFIGMDARSGKGFSFPWLTWGALAVLAPALVLLLVHLADVGLFRAPGGAVSEQDWQKLLPERLQRLYRIVKGAPVVVVLLGIVGLGAALMTLDGAFAVLLSFGAALRPHIPVLIAGTALVICMVAAAAVWLRYRTRRLMAEYAFRREVLEKTGVIIVDKGSAPLPPGGYGDMPYAIAGPDAPSARPSLPPGEVTVISVEATAATEENPCTEKNGQEDRPSS